MRFSFTFAVSVAAVAAVSAGVYRPAKTGVSVAHSKGGGNDDGSSEQQKPLRDGDRFHIQSPDGQYVFGHTAGNQGRAEMRGKDGTVTGYYSYAGGDGRVVYVNYVADKDGYRVLSNTGVPSASVAVEGGPVEKTAGPSAAADRDFQQVFSDFAKRIKDKLAGQVGQKVMDFVEEGQRQVPVDPTLYPSKETKPSTPKGRNEFPDWDRVKISTTHKPMHDEGQQQQEIVEDPNWDSVKITTQKPNIKGHDNDGQESIDNDRWSVTTTTETTVSPIPLVPNQPQDPETDVPTTARPLDDEPLAVNVPTAGDPRARTDFLQTTSESSEIDYTTIAAVDERVTITTTNQSDGRLVGDTETTTAGIQYATEEIEDRTAEFRTSEPAERLGTAVDPKCGRSEAQAEEIVWPEIPAQESVPQVLVPLDPYSKEERLPRTKKPGIKTHPINLRPARYSALDGVVKSTVVDVNVTETAATTVTAPTHSDDENATSFNFPRFYLTG